MTLKGLKVNGKIEMLRLNSVKANPWNPNEMSDETFESLKHGFKTEGWLVNQSLLVWETDELGRARNLIIDGEHRWRVAKELGMTEGPMVRLRGLSESQARAMTIAFNARRGQHNEDKLEALLKSIQSEISLSLTTGISSKDVERLLEGSVEALAMTSWEEPILLEKEDRPSIKNKEQFMVLVEFESEAEQASFLKECLKRELRHRSLIS